jgi:hypothetical protein
MALDLDTLPLPVGLPDIMWRNDLFPQDYVTLGWLIGLTICIIIINVILIRKLTWQHSAHNQTEAKPTSEAIPLKLTLHDPAGSLSEPLPEGTTITSDP